MKKILALSLALFCSNLASAQTNFCKGKPANDFYCVDAQKFQHCTGNDAFSLKQCSTPICVTRTPAERNPCVGREAALREDGVKPPLVQGGVVLQPIKPGEVVVIKSPIVQPGVNGEACVGGPKFDPAGTKNVGNGQGIQFIGGQCLSAKDCASGCCAGPCGICSGPGAQFQNGKNGCGFIIK